MLTHVERMPQIILNHKNYSDCQNKPELLQVEVQKGRSVSNQVSNRPKKYRPGRGVASFRIVSQSAITICVMHYRDQRRITIMAIGIGEIFEMNL